MLLLLVLFHLSTVLFGYILSEAFNIQLIIEILPMKTSLKKSMKFLDNTKKNQYFSSPKNVHLQRKKGDLGATRTNGIFLACLVNESLAHMGR